MTNKSQVVPSGGRSPSMAPSSQAIDAVEQLLSWRGPASAGRQSGNCGASANLEGCRRVVTGP
jgi:hypothetical protein